MPMADVINEWWTLIRLVDDEWMVIGWYVV